MKMTSNLRAKSHRATSRKQKRNDLPLFSVETMAQSTQTLADYRKSREILRQAIY